MVTTSTLPPSLPPSRQLAPIIWSSMCATSGIAPFLDADPRVTQGGRGPCHPEATQPAKDALLQRRSWRRRHRHHDIALLEDTSLPAPPAERSMFGTPCAINHIAIRGSVIPAGAIAAETGTAALQCATATSRCSSMGIASCSHQP